MEISTFQVFMWTFDASRHYKIIYSTQGYTESLKSTIIGVLMFFKCGKTNYMREKIVHATSDRSITQVSQIFWVILKRLRTSNIIYSAPSTHYELLISANLDICCSFA